MKASYNWLKDYVDIKVSPKVLAEKLTMAGLEVASCETRNNDTVFEIEITANRPDCLSILGIAQEAAAVLGARLKVKTTKSKLNAKSSKKTFLKKGFISIQNTKDCAFYRGCLIGDVKIGLSPEWLRNRIESLGVRPVNNVVDITNYCLLEYGQPLHAFDYNKIIEKIVVRRARKEEKILTIDGEERKLSENILVISDKNRAIAIAGIIGDKLSEVSSSTTSILLESAYFNPILVRSGSRELGISTESSYRFERQVDFDGVKIAQDKAIELICKIAGGKIIDQQEAGTVLKHKPRQIKFDCTKASSLLAFDISIEKAKKIFVSLGFHCKVAGKYGLLVTVPALRRDIKIEEDLIEEFARIYGYSNIPSTLPAIRSAYIENSEIESIKKPVREILCASGFSEAINYSLVSKDIMNSAFIGRDAIRLKNPLSFEQEYLRPTLAAGLLSCLAYNLNHKNLNLKLFEIGHIFGSDYSENMSLGLITSGKSIDNWQIKKESDFFELKGNVENLIERLGFGTVEYLALEDNSNSMFLHGDAVRILCQTKEVGVLGRADKRALLNLGIKNTPFVFYAEISLKELCKLKAGRKKFVPLGIFPSMVRDLSLVVKNSICYEEVVDLIMEEAGSYLKDIKLSDVYKGEQIAPGFVGLTISLELGLSDRTLTEEEAIDIHQKITKRLKNELGIEIR